MKRETINMIFIFLALVLIAFGVIENNNRILELEKKIEILEKEKMK